MLAGPALNPLDRTTDPWGLAVTAERGRRQQRGWQGEGMPPRRGGWGASDYEYVGRWVTGSASQGPPSAEWMVPKRLFQLGLVVGGTEFWQFRSVRRIWGEYRPSTSPPPLPTVGHFFHTPRPPHLQGHVKAGKGGQGGAPLPSGLGGGGRPSLEG